MRPINESESSAGLLADRMPTVTVTVAKSEVDSTSVVTQWHRPFDTVVTQWSSTHFNLA